MMPTDRRTRSELKVVRVEIKKIRNLARFGRSGLDELGWPIRRKMKNENVDFIQYSHPNSFEPFQTIPMFGLSGVGNWQ